VVYTNVFQRTPVNGPRISEKATSSYDEMKIINKCTFSEG
jgi:hypothetical protein